LTLHGPQNLLCLTPLSFAFTPPFQAARILRRFVDWVAGDRAAHAAFLEVRWLSTDVVEAVVRVHGGLKFYHGAAAEMLGGMIGRTLALEMRVEVLELALGG